MLTGRWAKAVKYTCLVNLGSLSWWVQMCLFYSFYPAFTGVSQSDDLKLPLVWGRFALFPCSLDLFWCSLILESLLSNIGNSLPHALGFLSFFLCRVFHCFCENPLGLSSSFFTCVCSLIQLTHWDLMSMITFVISLKTDSLSWMWKLLIFLMILIICYPNSQAVSAVSLVSLNINIYHQLFTALAFLKRRCARLCNWHSLSAKEESSDVGQENEFQSPAAWDVISDFTFACLSFPIHKKKAVIAPPLQGFWEN